MARFLATILQYPTTSTTFQLLMEVSQSGVNGMSAQQHVMRV